MLYSTGFWIAALLALLNAVSTIALCAIAVLPAAFRVLIVASPPRQSWPATSAPTDSDPVRVGLVANFSRPSGNVTGVTQTNQLVTPKRLQLLHELIPKAAVIALLVNPTDETFSEALRKQVQAAADALDPEIHILNVSSDQNIDDAFAKLSQLRVGGLVVTGGPFFTSRAERLAALALRYAMPTIFQYLGVSPLPEGW